MTSGKAPTPESRLKRAAAGIAGGKARAAKASMPQQAKASQNPTTHEAGAIMTLADYDEQIGLPVSWADAIKREQLMGEKIANETKQIEMDKIKGKLLTEEQVSERDDIWNKAASDESEKVQRLIDGIEGISPEQRKAYLERFKEWRRKLSEILARVHN